MGAMPTLKIKRKVAIPVVMEFIRHLSGERKWAWEYESCANVVAAYSNRVVVGVDPWACGIAYAHYCRAIAVLSFRPEGVKALGRTFTGVRGLTPTTKTTRMDAIMSLMEFDAHSVARATAHTRYLLERFKLTPDCVSIGRKGTLSIFEHKLSPESRALWDLCGKSIPWAKPRAIGEGKIIWDVDPTASLAELDAQSPPKKAAPKAPGKRRGKAPSKPPPVAAKRRTGPPSAPHMGPPKPPSLGSKPKRKTTPPPPTKKGRRH